jgi:hypothetical protein
LRRILAHSRRGSGLTIRIDFAWPEIWFVEMSSLTPCFPFGHLADDNAGPNRFPPIAIAESFQMHLLTVAHISPIVSLIAGVLILIMPRFLNFIVAAFLILNGLLGLGLLKWLHL